MKRPEPAPGVQLRLWEEPKVSVSLEGAIGEDVVGVLAELLCIAAEEDNGQKEGNGGREAR